MRYKKKPVIIEAFQLTKDITIDDTPVWFFVAVKNGDVLVDNNVDIFYIKTLEGTMKADTGDYIIRGVNGEIYPCKPEIFEKTYEVVTDA